MTKPLSHFRAVGFSLLGFTIWVLSDVCLKLAGESSLPMNEIMLFFGLAGVAFLLPRAYLRHEVKALWPKDIRRQSVRALLVYGSNFANVVALKHLSMSLFFITVFTTPMMTAILAVIFLREHLTPMKTLAIIGGFLGVAIGIDPLHGNLFSDWVGYAAALISALFFAISMTWLRVMTKSESTDSLAFFSSLVNIVISSACMLFGAEPLTLRLTVILLAMGGFGILGNLCNYVALKYTTAANVAQFHYTQIITGAMFGYLIWHDLPTAHLLVGAVIIIASGLYIAAHARNQKQP